MRGGAVGAVVASHHRQRGANRSRASRHSAYAASPQHPGGEEAARQEYLAQPQDLRMAVSSMYSKHWKHWSWSNRLAALQHYAREGGSESGAQEASRPAAAPARGSSLADVPPPPVSAHPLRGSAGPATDGAEVAEARPDEVSIDLDEGRAEPPPSTFAGSQVRGESEPIGSEAQRARKMKAMARTGATAAALCTIGLALLSLRVRLKHTDFAQVDREQGRHTCTRMADFFIANCIVLTFTAAAVAGLSHVLLWRGPARNDPMLLLEATSYRTHAGGLRPGLMLLAGATGVLSAACVGLEGYGSFLVWSELNPDACHGLEADARTYFIFSYFVWGALLLCSLLCPPMCIAVVQGQL